MKHANYVIVADDPLSTGALVIRDVGPWDRHPTITNDAEHVVEELSAAGKLPPGRRLYYYDSEDQLDELLIAHARFAGFAPGALPLR